MSSIDLMHAVILKRGTPKINFKLNNFNKIVLTELLAIVLREEACSNSYTI